MTTVRLLGNFGHSNLGDEAILQGLLSVLEELKSKDLNLVILTDDVGDTQQRYAGGVEIVQSRRE